MIDIPKALDAVLHDAPCPLSRPSNWFTNDGGETWHSINAFSCACSDEAAPAPSVEDAQLWARKHRAKCDLSNPARWTIEPDEVEFSATGDCTCEPALTLAAATAAGWRAPHGMAYPLLPETSVRRGGISFTDPLGLEDLTEEQLRERVQMLTNALRGKDRRIQKLRRKNRRLVRLIERLA